jgi:hypothetical protein
MATLGVNIDHVATVRQARRTVEPDPVWAAALAELGGADAITVHLREDRRHIQDRDLEVLRRTVQVKLNLEAAISPAMIDIACRVRPDQVTLVPEKREEVTTEGGLDVVTHRTATAAAIGRLQAAGIVVSLFLDPAPTPTRPPTRRDTTNSWSCRVPPPWSGRPGSCSTPATASPIATWCRWHGSREWASSTSAIRSSPGRCSSASPRPSGR